MSIPSSSQNLKVNMSWNTLWSTSHQATWHEGPVSHQESQQDGQDQATWTHGLNR